MSVNIYTIIDDDITINERIESDIYNYLIKIVDKYKEHSLMVYLVLYSDEKAYYIKLYESSMNTCA